MDINVGAKPVPVPRQRLSTSSQQSPPVKVKPVPLPRKLTTTTSLGEKKENMVITGDDDDNFNLSSIPDAPSLLPPSAKRGTINIFQLANQLDDPFNDFDVEFKKEENIDHHHRPAPLHITPPPRSPRSPRPASSPHPPPSKTPEASSSPLLLSNISFPSPLFDLDEDTRRRISTFSSLSSTSTDDSSDHYMEPPPARPVSAELAANLSKNVFSGVYRGSRTGSGRSSKLPPLHDGNEEEDEQERIPVVRFHHHHHPVEKVASCPPAPLADEDEEYEPIAAPSSTQNFERLPSSPGFPSNNNFHDNKRVTVPNVNVNFNINHNEGSMKGKKGLSRFTESRLKFEGSNDLNSSRSSGSHRQSDGGVSDTESTDSFQFSRSKNDIVKRSSSQRSSTGSLRRVHEYDDVAIEDGTVVFLDNMENAATLSDETNNNSSNSLASRNSVIAEFDPLLYSFAEVPKPPLPPPSIKRTNLTNGTTPPIPKATTNQINDNDDDDDITSEKYLDLNDDPQHRYEYIDTDAEDGRSSCSNSNNEDSLPINPPPSVENPTYSFEVDFKANFRKQPNQPPQQEVQDQEGNANGSAVMEEEYESVEPPPTPPKPGQRSPTSKELVQSPPSPPSASSNGGGDASVPSFFRRFSSKFRLNSIREESTACRKCGNEHGEKERCRFYPPYRDSVIFSTNLYKPGGNLGRKEWTPRRVVLQPRSTSGKGRLSFYNDKSELVSDLPLEKVAVITKKEGGSSSSPPNLQYFELGLVHWKQNSLVLAAADELERAKWMGKYVEAHTAVIPPLLRGSFERGGWVFLKETVTSDWKPGWILLKDRNLIFVYQDGEEYFDMDLRKARSIDLCGKEEEQRCGFVDNGDVLTLDLCCRILYLQTESSRITRDWEKALRSAASRNGTRFDEMQLTLENVPVVVDKCIDFLYAHGTLAEGIYRQSGSNTRIAQLLADFQKDAWAVQVSPKEFSAHDVAGTLKRFFRTLPEPLVTSELYPAWIKAAAITDRTAKETEYTRLLESLPPLNYNILKKLMCHLYAVHELHEKNLMPLINLAPIWGPTLMSVDGGASGLSYDSACAECEVVKELIEGYCTLFRVDEEERARERRMHLALENFHLGSLRRKCSGDMKLWIYLWDKDETSATNVALTPYSTAQGIVAQILENSRVRNIENVGLHEVIANGSLERVLHPSEKVIDTVLRWSLWDIEDRKDNYLILKKNQLYPRLLQYAKEPHMLGSEVKVADSKSKSYRKAQLQFSQATLKLFKDAKCNTEQASYKIEDVVWYVGCETRRNPPTKWTFTLAPKTYHLKRSKEEPFFGWVFGCGSEEELHRWLGALVVGEHPEGLYPNVVL